MYQAYITTIKNLRPHPNADRLDLGECFGNTVCIGHGDFAEGDLVVYFPVDGQLSEEFCAQHNLVRRKDDAGNNIGGYLDPAKRNVKAISLRGEKSDGLVMPLKSLEYTGVDIRSLEVGFCFTAVNGKEICCKYIPRRPNCAAAGGANRTRKKKVPTAPLFAEHADTEQLAYNLSAFRPGDEIEITLKMHGTSQRTGYLPVLQGYRRSILDRLFRREGEPIYDYGYVSGTRRTVLEDFDGGYYGSNEFREIHSKQFEGKLWKGETVYYEVVGFTTSGAPIMGDGSNEKLGKDFVKQYGKTTTFSYGCDPHPSSFAMTQSTVELCGHDIPCVHAEAKTELPQSDCYVYRMTMTNPDGQVVEYTPDFMRYRCEQMGVKTVPVFCKCIIPDEPSYQHNGVELANGDAGEYIKNMAELYYDGPDPVGKTHVREGVVVRIVNRPKFTAFKHKNFAFKVLSGIAVEQLAESGNLEAMSEDLIAEL